MDTPTLLDEDLLKKVKSVYSTVAEDVLPRYRYKGTTVSENMLKVLDDILNMEVREDDTWICTYMKSGTHWSSEMVWLISNDLDYEGSKVSQLQRVPFLEFEHFLSHCPEPENASDFPMDPKLFLHSVDYVKTMKSPRFIKTHLPFQLLPLQIQQGTVNAKVIYVRRNPMDVFVSLFEMFRKTYNYEGIPDDFADLFLRGGLKYLPYWKHCQSFCERKDERHILCLKFEDMIEDLSAAINQTADFLGKKLTTDQVASLSDHLSFANMKNKKSVNLLDEMSTVKKLQNLGEGKTWNLCRNGVVGKGKESLSLELVARFKTWTEENTKGTVLERPLEHYGFD
ncbi:luciferin sulfotransferase-like [Macrosteles quadrilineatus]|uniref:luciferin sulfotransferase-like n=1 Tax=Macrosteles quadrilineatus TaxID=74068 RepID=UPI0023E0F2C6|nr:luciferin sulfotransferase-like [Macrosteles quadrilineatus]